MSLCWYLVVRQPLMWFYGFVSDFSLFYFFFEGDYRNTNKKYVFLLNRMMHIPYCLYVGCLYSLHCRTVFVYLLKSISFCLFCWFLFVATWYSVRCKRPSFGLQNVAFCLVKACLLQDESMLFARWLCSHRMCTRRATWFFIFSKSISMPLTASLFWWNRWK